MLRILRGLFLVSAFSLFSAAAFAQVPGDFKTLVWNNSHVVSYEKRGASLVMRLELIGDMTENRGGETAREWDYASMKIDLNNNGKLDRSLDIAFGQRSRTDIICPQYLFTRSSSSVCGGFPSRTKLKVSFGASSFADVAHPVFEFVIPLKELDRHSKTIGLQFMFHSAPDKFTFYPAGLTHFTDFKNTIPLDLDAL